jgi:hypothetical protein
MQPPLLQDFGYLADTPSAEDILNGTYYVPPIGTDQCAIKILQHMKRPDAVMNAPPITPHITLISHSNGWKKQMERSPWDLVHYYR